MSRADRDRLLCAGLTLLLAALTVLHLLRQPGDVVFALIVWCGGVLCALQVFLEVRRHRGRQAPGGVR